MKFLQRFFMLTAVLSAYLTVSAYDFEIDGIQYTITSTSDLTVEVSSVADINAKVVSIPNTVSYKTKVLTVTSIGSKAFASMDSLCEVNIPISVKNIKFYAFQGAKSLKNIILPDSLETMGNYVFADCDTLQSIIIPKGVTNVPDYAFQLCKELKDVTLNENLKSIGKYAFCSTDLINIKLPDSLESLGSGAFAYSSIVEFSLPPMITTVPDYLCSHCTSLTKVNLPSTVTGIGKSAFEKCEALRNISLPENLQTIGSKAFRYCATLKEFIIPDKTSDIEPDILWDCDSLEKLQIGAELDALPSNRYHPTGSIYYYYYYFQSCYRKSNEYVTAAYVYLQNLKEVIISDSESQFGIGGFYMHEKLYPSFSNVNLNYYYVGRPLTEIKKYDGYNIDVNMGYGHINKLEIAGINTSVPYFYQKVDTLILGENINTFNTNNIYSDTLQMIICRATTPPVLKNYSSNFKTNLYTDAVVKVPTGCKELYQNADGWKNFWNITEGDVSAVRNIETESDDTPPIYYDLQGRMVNNPHNGIFIKSVGNKKTKVIRRNSY